METNEEQNCARLQQSDHNQETEEAIFEMSKICAEPVITARCMPVKKVSELRQTCSDVICWRVPKKLSRRRGGCVGLCSRAQLLCTDCADQKHDGNDWRHSLMLIGSHNCDVAKVFFFLNLISCDYVFKLCMNISKHYDSAISVWDRPMWSLSYFYKKLKYMFVLK